MKRISLALLCTCLLLATIACGGDSPQRADEPTDVVTSASPTETPTNEAPTEPPTSIVEVVVLYPNILDLSCEALSGIYKSLHNGSQVVIETETGQVVGEGRLGDPPAKVPNSLCAWGAKIDAAVEPGTKYRARAATRFTSKLVDGGKFATTRLIINASS